MTYYKLTIIWANGLHKGYLGVGVDEEDARCHAFRRVFDDSGAAALGFRVIQPADVFSLPKGIRDSLESDWKTQREHLDMWTV